MQIYSYLLILLCIYIFLTNVSSISKKKQKELEEIDIRKHFTKVSNV